MPLGVSRRELVGRVPLLFHSIADKKHYILISLTIYVPGANVVKACQHKYWTSSCAPKFGLPMHTIARPAVHHDKKGVHDEHR
jgi:hypothetical protein